ncbi:MAG: hypothetical protein HC834_06315, partial [Rhodospirillales bacterium]|nr:hypothetical protein [Rhodospirillales bacterium]
NASYEHWFNEHWLANFTCARVSVENNPNQTSVNVLPDFMPPGKLTIQRIRANGLDVTETHKPRNADDFQVSLKELGVSKGSGLIELEIEFEGVEPTI